jgi:hypothetical protein
MFRMLMIPVKIILHRYVENILLLICGERTSVAYLLNQFFRRVNLVVGEYVYVVVYYVRKLLLGLGGHMS